MRGPKKVKPLGDDTVFAHLIPAGALSPLVLAYKPFWADKGDPVPLRFNRHATVHKSSTIQFTRENALVALMLVTSLARTMKHNADVESRKAA